MFKERQKSSRRNAKRKKTLQIYGAEKYTSARHACCMRKGFLYIIECHRRKTKS